MLDVMKGIRILEVAEHTFVPAASAVLADWGADVIKVEHAERGDAMRGLAQTGVVSFATKVHVLLEHSNRGKRSIGIDLSVPQGLELVYRLAATADVFLTNKTPPVLRKLKIDVGDVRKHNPKIIYTRGTAFGPAGPDGDKGGYDFSSFWCRAGSAASCTPQGLAGVVSQPGPGYGDSIGAMTIAGGIAGALLKRERTGEPSVVDVSLLGTGIWALGQAIAMSLQSGAPLQSPPVGGHMAATNPLVGTYRTSDGRFISLVMLQAFAYWPDFCDHIGRSELARDPRFDTHENLARNALTAVEILREVIAAKPLAEWTQRFSTLRGQWAPVQNSLEVAADPQARAMGYIAGAKTADGTPFELGATPVQFDERPTPTARSPQFNEHGDEILQELGMDWEQIIELRAAGAIA
jgi:crotonobetainyl-CoA:carnitine CoA-transferase CaiB-like acyl-CoA transferase